MAKDPLDIEKTQQDLKELLEQRWRSSFGPNCGFEVAIVGEPESIRCTFVLNNPEEDFRLTLEGQMNLRRTQTAPLDALDDLIDILDGYIGKFADNPVRSPIPPRWTVTPLSRKRVVSIRGQMSRPRLDAEAERILEQNK